MVPYSLRVWCDEWIRMNEWRRRTKRKIILIYDPISDIRFFVASVGNLVGSIVRTRTRTSFPYRPYYYVVLPVQCTSRLRVRLLVRYLQSLYSGPEEWVPREFPKFDTGTVEYSYHTSTVPYVLYKKIFRSDSTDGRCAMVITPRGSSSSYHLFDHYQLSQKILEFDLVSLMSVSVCFESKNPINHRHQSSLLSGVACAIIVFVV